MAALYAGGLMLGMQNKIEKIEKNRKATSSRSVAGRREAALLAAAIGSWKRDKRGRNTLERPERERGR